MLWLKKNKYYTVGIQYNLFGTSDLVIGWGNVYNKLGNHKIIPLDNADVLPKVIAQITKRRKARKYALVRDTL